MIVNRFYYTSGVAVVTPTDRHKSVRNRCVIEDFGVVFCCQVVLLFFCGCRGFCQRTRSDLCFFLVYILKCVGHSTMTEYL